MTRVCSSSISFTLRMSRLSPAVERTSKRLFRWAKEGSWIVIGQTVTVLGSLILVRVLTEHLEPVQYGQLALGFTLVGLVKQVAIGGILNGIGRFFSIASGKNELHAYVIALWRLTNAAALAVVAIGIPVILFLRVTGYSQWSGLAAAALLFAVISSYNSSFNAVQNAARQRMIVAFHGGMDAVLKIPLVLGLLLLLGNSGAVVVLGYAVSSLMVAASQWYFLRRAIPYSGGISVDSSSWLKQIWRFSLPFMTWGVFTWLQTSSDRWFLGAFAGAENVGLYAVLFQLGYTPVAMVTGMMVDFFSPVLYLRSGDASDLERNRNVHRLVWLITSSCLVLTVLFVLIAFGLHEFIFRHLVAVNYRHASNLLPFLVLAGGLFATGQVLSLKLLSELRSHSLIRVKIITASLGVVLNYVGASLAGLGGIVAAIVAFGAIYLVWMIILTIKSPADLAEANGDASTFP